MFVGPSTVHASTSRTRRWAPVLSVALLASGGAAITFAPPALAATTPGAPLSMSGNMEGSIAFAPGSWVAGGYRYKFGTPGVGVSFAAAKVAVPVSCTKGGSYLSTQIAVPMLTGPWTSKGSTNVPWKNLTPNGNESELAFQGAVRAPDLCNGATMYNAGGVTFTAGVISQSNVPIKVEFHYRVPAGKNKPNTNCADRNDANSSTGSVCNAGLSSATTITPTTGTGGITGLSMTTSTPTQPAGHGTIPLAAIPGSALLNTAASLVGAPGFGTPGFGTLVFGTPGFGTLVFGTPGFGTPGFGTPGFGTLVFGTPLTDSILTDPTLTDISLAQMPIAPQPGSSSTWESILAGTALGDRPIQTLTIADVLALSPRPAALSNLTLGELDISATELREASAGAYLLGRTPLSALPVPTGFASWCAYLASTSYDCTAHPTATTQSLVDLELAGVNLRDYFASTSVDLVGLALAHSPITYLLLNNVDLSLSSLGKAATTAITNPSEFVTCTPSGSDATCDTLANAQKAGKITTTGTVGRLLTTSPGAVGSLDLADLLGASIPRQNLPLESVPVGSIVAQSPMPTSGAAYRISFGLSCAQAANLAIAPALPEGFRVIPATVKMTLGSTTDIPINVDGDGTITPKNAVTCSGTQPIVVDLQAEPSTLLGPTTAGVSVAVNGGLVSIADRAPVEVTKNFIVDNNANPANPASFNTAYAGHISKPGDLDFFSLPAPPAGSQIVVTLSHQANDNDLVLYGPGQPQLRATPGFGTPGFGTPGFGTPGFGTPGFGTPGFGTPGFGTLVFGTAVEDASTSFGDGGDGATPTLDPDVPRLKLPVRGFSNQRDLTNETITTKVLASDTSPFLIQVSGYNGSWSPKPYILRVSVVQPPTAIPCGDRTYAHNGTPGILPTTPLDPTTQTLFLVNKQRLGDIYGAVAIDGTTADAGDQVVGKLTQLSTEPSVKGVVVPIEGDATVRDAFTAWDNDACNPAAANSVVSATNALVDRLRTNLPDLRNIVLVGIDDVVPYGRVTDLGAVYNESQYRQLAFDGIANAESSAARAGYLLTDNAYGDLAPTPFLDRSLYVPQLAVGRLVETPSDIAGQVDSYLAAGGVTSPTSSFVTGYTPFDKGARQVAAALSKKPGVTSSTQQINSTWTRADGKAGFEAAARGFGAVNAHYDIYRALPGNEDEGNPLTTADLPPSLEGGVQFTIGCHSGLSVPDIYVGSPTATQFDWPQAMLRKKVAGYVGNTGYGLGDTDAIAYSEKLSTLFADLVGPTMTLGQAMTFAKQAYVSSVGHASVYDAKVVEEATFYGLPMWRVGANGVSAKSTLPTTTATAPENARLAATPVTTGLLTHTEVPAISGRGTYFTVGDQPPLVTPQQPIQPQTTLTLPVRNDNLVAHGALIEGLTSRDVGSINPVYSTPIADGASTDLEPGVKQSYFPSTLQSVSGSVSPAGRQDTITFAAGQFASGANGLGTQRLFTEIKASVLSSDSADVSPPRISSVTGAIEGTTARFAVTTPDTDVKRGVVLMLATGKSTSQEWTHVELVNNGAGQMVGSTTVGSGVTQIGQYFAQLADSSGNVGVSSNKGQNYSAGRPGGLGVNVSPAPDPLTGIYPSPVTVTLTLPAGTTATYTKDGGPATDYTGPVTLSGEGPHSFSATSSDGQTVTTGVGINSAAPTVSVSGLTTGATFVHGTTSPEISVKCTSAVTIYSCYGPPAIDTSQIGTRSYEAVGQDVFGRTSVVTLSYTVTNSAPTVTLIKAPITGTTKTTDDITYAIEDVDDDAGALTTTCTLDGAAVPCSNSSVSLTGLVPRADSYTVVITARDPHGAVGTATVVWRVFHATSVTAQPVARAAPDLVATLRVAPSGQGLAGRLITFYAGQGGTSGRKLGTALTGSDGSAHLANGTVTEAFLAGGFSAVFTAADPYAASAGSAGILT